MSNNPIAISTEKRTKLETACSESQTLLLGVTGGIASGKTTAANLLKEKGALIIDFDVLARKVVEPGKPAFEEIIEYFGKDVLQDNGQLDRKKISDIVFQDTEKRKRLEGYIHPRIMETFVQQVVDLSKGSQGRIIQAVVPLLIENSMQELFHKILLVYIPREKQIDRLMVRDSISKKSAKDILNAQMPIDEKREYADYIIHNDGDLDSTKKQVDVLWNELIDLRKSKRKN